MNPYTNLPSEAFWKTAVATKNMFKIDNLWNPKFNIRPTDKIVTYGSCFAQHIGKALKERGYSWLSTELPPYGLSALNEKEFNYNIFSSRTGNIYTTSLLRQWIDWSIVGGNTPREHWENGGRFYDPFRPRIEPNGFRSSEELMASREATMGAFKTSIIDADIFVFTLGLTESWFNKKFGYEYPMCPGTAAGTFDKDQHVFKNQQFDFIINNLNKSIDTMMRINNKLRFILTVSPVPLTATMSGNHVVTATIESKSILRAVAGQLSANRPYIDYFPSYEIINSPVFRGSFFEANQRSVDSYGVDFVMNTFFNSLKDKFHHVPKKKDAGVVKYDEVCEEELLAAFSKN